jgi:elongation factor Ts
MAEITAQAVNEFRKATGLGLMECKALLKEADGDLKKAMTLAQERGKANAAKRAGRAAKAGRIEVYIHHDAKSGALVEVNCETDFVARNDEFKQLAKDLALHIMAANPLCVRREDVPKDLALHVVAANPVAVTREDVPAAVVEEQRRIFLKQAEDKPEQIRGKIAEGKLNSWFAESVLLDQVFVKDSAKTVREVIMEVNARVGENVSVARFARFIVGETPGAGAAEAEG